MNDLNRKKLRSTETKYFRDMQQHDMKDLLIRYEVYPLNLSRKDQLLRENEIRNMTRMELLRKLESEFTIGDVYVPKNGTTTDNEFRFICLKYAVYNEDDYDDSYKHAREMSAMWEGDDDDIEMVKVVDVDYQSVDSYNKMKRQIEGKKTFICSCGCTVRQDNKAKHLKTQKHING